MAAALRSNTSRETASLTLSHFRHFISNRLHTATPHSNHNHHRNKIASLNPTTGGERRCYATEKVRGVVKSALLCSSSQSQGGDPPDLWQPPADEVSFLRVNPVRGGGGPGAGVGVGTGSDSKEDAWGGSNLGSSFPTPKDICNGLDKFVIGQERAKKVKNDVVTC